MNKPTIPQLDEGMVSLVNPNNFELEEIRWDEPEHQIHSDFLPFENTTKKILEDLKQ